MSLRTLLTVSATAVLFSGCYFWTDPSLPKGDTEDTGSGTETEDVGTQPGPGGTDTDDTDSESLTDTGSRTADTEGAQTDIESIDTETGKVDPESASETASTGTETQDTEGTGSEAETDIDTVTQSATEAGSETDTDTETETESDDCSLTACEEAQLCKERECDGKPQLCTNTGDGWEWSTSDVCGIGSCLENTCASNTLHYSYSPTCIRYCNEEEAVCDECTCAPLETACTGGGCCAAACNNKTGCFTTEGACPDTCEVTTLTTGRTCTGCGTNGAEGTCSEGRSTTCSATNACELMMCGGRAYHCIDDGNTWTWSDSFDCAGGTCQNGVCCALPMTDCDGGKLDPATDLCWQDPPSDIEMNWFEASGTYHVDHNPDTEDYCGELVHGGHSDWRLPNIEELISVIRGCEDGNETGNLSTSICKMTPDSCAAADSCGGKSDCSSCSAGDGPASSGCYWDPSLTGVCTWYWSSSTYANVGAYGWIVGFVKGDSLYDGKAIAHHARCVRGGS